MSFTEGLVSVIIPVYNVEKYLKQCVDSVLNQTYRHIEIILVDDGSLDSCAGICDNYARQDARVKVIHKENGGLSDARNAGFKICGGGFVYFLDSDDYIRNDAIQILYDAAVSGNADFVFFDAVDIYENRESSAKRANERYIRKESYRKSNGADMLNNLLVHKEYRSAVPLTFIKREYLLNINLSFYKGIIHEDELFTYLLFMQSRIVAHVPEALYFRRVRDNSIMTARKSKQHFIGYHTVFFKMAEFYTAQTLTQYEKTAAEKCMSLMFKKAIITYNELGITDKANTKNEMKKLILKIRSMDFLNDKANRLICFSRHAYFLAKKIKNTLLAPIKGMLKKLLKIYKFRKLLSRLKRNRKEKRLILIGTPTHGNLGDHAITIAEMEMLGKMLPSMKVVEVTMPFYHARSKAIAKYITKNDVILIHGGGFLGTVWLHAEIAAREIIDTYPDNKIIILPQTVFYGDEPQDRHELELSQEVYVKHNNLYACMRERKSYNFMIENRLIQNESDCLLIPDTVLSLNYSHLSQNRDGVLLCFRQDHEKIFSDSNIQKVYDFLLMNQKKFGNTTLVLSKGIEPESRKSEVEKKLAEFSNAELIITDRLHGMIFAAITGTPCIAVNNLTGKVKGVYEWLAGLEYIKFVDTVDEALSHINDLLEQGGCVYNNDKLLPYYSSMIEKIQCT